MSTSAQNASARPICFIASDKDFLFRHFSPAMAAAKARNAEVVAYVPGERLGTEVRINGIRVISSPTVRKHNSPFCLIGEALWFASRLRKVNPAIVVAYSLRMCVVVALIQPLLVSSRFVFVVTGVGFVGISESLRARFLRLFTFAFLRHVSRRRSHFIFENAFDAVSMGIDRRGHQFSILMGAGIDPREFPQHDFPRGSPFRFATVSRLVWSKGIDLAIDAISALADEGVPVELHIYGAPDFANPRPLDPASLTGISGVHYHGFSHQIASVWKDYHAAIFTSRGGEGLPRALLEAAACGRPCIVTAVPGGLDFVRDGVEGYVVPLGSKLALKEAILRLISEPESMQSLGRQARQRVCATSTADIIQARYEEIFRCLTLASEVVAQCLSDPEQNVAAYRAVTMALGKDLTVEVVDGGFGSCHSPQWPQHKP